jgi:hypothetical protein
MKSPMFLLRLVLEEIEDECGISTSRDLKTITARVDSEGESFLTISLANFGKDFERSLDQGYVDRTSFQGFSWKGGLPRLFSGFLGLVFDSCDGVLLDVPSIAAIRAIRQVTLMFAKIELECTKARQLKAIEGYVECEKEVRASDASLDPVFLDRISEISARLWGPALSQLENSLYAGDWDAPLRHGSGQTADRSIGNAKFNTWTWTERLESVLPFGDYCLPNARYSSECLPRVDFLEPGLELPVKVTLVPKTLKTPRVIAMEPSWNMFVQQGLMVSLRDCIGGVSYLRDLVGWHDQVPNQDLAKKGSKDQSLATLDLSEASDRVSNQHVLALFRRFPLLSEVIQACRSTKADVPGWPQQRLAKFASMGSALTFPVEAMVFLTIIVFAIEEELSTRLTIRDYKSLVGRVRVYGDDLIVPVEFVIPVTDKLEAFGLKVNRSKSFWTGKFRESCGKDYYDGEDVSIFKMRNLFPSRRADAVRREAAEVQSLYELRNQAYWHGYWRIAREMDKLIQSYRYPNPTVLQTSPVLGRNSVLGYETQELHKHLHTPLVRGFVDASRPPQNAVDGVPALFKCLSKTSEDPFDDAQHLLRSGRPPARALKRVKGTPF